MRTSETMIEGSFEDVRVGDFWLLMNETGETTLMVSEVGADYFSMANVSDQLSGDRKLFDELCASGCLCRLRLDL